MSKSNPIITQTIITQTSIKSNPITHHNSCPICFDDYTIVGGFYPWKCYHSNCMDCFSNLVKNKIHQNCHTCKTSLLNRTKYTEKFVIYNDPISKCKIWIMNDLNYYENNENNKPIEELKDRDQEILVKEAISRINTQ